MADAYEWLSDFFKAKQYGKIPTVADVVPTVFKRYFILEDNYGIIDEFPFDEYPDDKQELENLNKRHNIERQFGLFLNYDSEHLYRPLSIKDIANRFNVAYSQDTPHVIKHTPGVTSLPERSQEHLHRLVSTLIVEPCYLYVEDVDRAMPLDDKGYHRKNSVNSTDEYFQFQKITGFDYCSYLFPKNRAWCLSSFEDIHNLVLSCDDEIANKLGEIKDLEYFEVKPETRFRNVW